MPDSLTLPVGATHDVELPGLGTAGYRWDHTLDGDADVLDVTWQRGVPAGSAAPTPTGRSHPERVTLHATRPGTVTVRLRQQRAWETEKPPLHQHSITIHVIPGPSPQETERPRPDIACTQHPLNS